MSRFTDLLQEPAPEAPTPAAPAAPAPVVAPTPEVKAVGTEKSAPKKKFALDWYPVLKPSQGHLVAPFLLL